MDWVQLVGAGFATAAVAAVSNVAAAVLKRRTEAEQGETTRETSALANYERALDLLQKHEQRYAELLAAKHAAEQQYQRDRQALIDAHLAALDVVRRDLNQTHQDAIVALERKHQAALADQRREYDGRIANLEIRIKELEAQQQGPPGTA